MNFNSYAAGTEAKAMDVGDFILTHRKGVVGSGIRWGQALRYRGDRRCFCYWNHAALIVTPAGDLVEALTRTGATRSHIRKYQHIEYTLVRTNTHPMDQEQMLDFADNIVGQPYGFSNDLCCFLSCSVGNKLNITIQNHVMCSELVARAQERGGAIFERLPEAIMPADLAWHYNVKGVS